MENRFFVFKLLTILAALFYSILSCFAEQSQKNSVEIKYGLKNNTHKLGTELSTKIDNNRNFYGNFFADLYPDAKASNWALKQNSKNLSIMAGSLSYSLSKSKMNNPSWSSIDCMRTNSVTRLGSKAFMPTLDSSEQKFSSFVHYAYPLAFNQDKNKLYFAPAANIIWTPKESIFSSLEFPFKFGKNTLEISVNYANSKIEWNSEKWYMNIPYFESGYFSKIMVEANYFYRFVELYADFYASQDPIIPEQYKFAGRIDGVFKFDFSKNVQSATELRAFLSQNDFFTLNGKILREPLHYCALENVKVKFDLFNINFAVLYDSKYSYSEGSKQIPSTKSFLQGGIKLDFLTWNITTKARYNWNVVSGSNAGAYSFQLSYWVQILHMNGFKLSNSGSAKLSDKNSNSWNAQTKIDFKWKDLSFEVTEKFEGNYGKISARSSDKRLTSTSKFKISWKRLWADFQIKKSVFEQESSKTDLKISTGITLMF